MAEIILDENETLQRANTLYFNGKITEALTLSAELIEKEALLEQAYRLQSACYYQLQQYSKAENAIDKLLEINDGRADDHFNLAHIYNLQNKLSLAEKAYQKGIAISPKHITAIISLSDIYVKQGKKEQAINLLKDIVTKHPDHAEAQYKLALLEENQDAIIAYLKKTAKQKPLDYEAKFNLAKLYMDNAEFKKAVYYITESIATNSSSYQANYLAGLNAYYNKQWDEANKHYRSALKLKLDEPATHLALAKNFLAQNKYEEGWQAFEWRRKLSQPAALTTLLDKTLYWHGQSLQNKHLLIYAEPDYGSTFLFMRYLREIKKENTTITLFVPLEEIKTVSKFNIVDHIITPQDHLPEKIDYIASLLSLPDILHLKQGEASLQKYLSFPLPPSETPIKKIGLSWSQNFEQPYKSINQFDNKNFEDLINSIEAEFVCLNLEPLSAEEINWCKHNKVQYNEGNTLETLFATIANLDLVVTMDNQVAHMAACIDKPTWVTTSYVSSWYLGAQAQQTSWYPTMRLFRQRKINDWQYVIRYIIDIIKNKAISKNIQLIHPEILAVQTAKSLNDQAKYQECIDFCKKYQKQYPKQPSFPFYLGVAQSSLGNNDLAICSLFLAHELDSSNADIYTNLGTCFYRLDITDKALEYFERAVELKPNSADCLRNLAITYFELGFTEQSLTLYKRAILAKDTIENHFGYSLQLLGAGHYEEGWREYEYRLKMPQHNYNSLKINTPIWDGSSLNGKTIFILSEQGLGDNIQFLRFLSLLKQHYDCKIIFGCSSNLLRLVRQYTDVDQFICENDLIPKHDFHLPIISLAMHFKIYHESQFMANKPYIIPHPILRDYWKQVFATTRSIKVGFCWSGSPQHINNLRRNCDLFDFIKLKFNKNIKLYSLQKDLTDNERELLTNANIEDLGEMFDDLADTAAAISQLDLVLSIDSALGHLAGAMGKPTWLLLPYYSEWRHPRNREVSPWYDSVKFYQQTSPGDWPSAFKKVETDLQNMIQKHGQTNK